MFAEWAAELDEARLSGVVLTELLSERGLSTLADAYAVQQALTARRLARGATIIGWKLGYTSLAMRTQMGIDGPNLGPLTDAMLLPQGDPVPSSALQPRVEPEIALVLDSELQPSAAFACLEIVDSVWRDYRFTLLDNTADGSSAGWFVLGPELPMTALELLPVELSADGDVVGSATGAAAGGHPANGVAWLAEQLADDPRGLQPGDVVITGGLTQAVELRPGGSVCARFGADVTVAVGRTG